MMDALSSRRIAVAFAARALSEGGHDDFNKGQVSQRVVGSETMLIKTGRAGFDECTPDDVIEAPIPFDHPASPAAPPELALHQAVYQARPDVNAIIHSHAPYTLVMGASRQPLQAISHDGAYFVGRVPKFDLTSNTILDAASGQDVARALGSAPAAFLQNHGGVVVGKSIKHATVFALALERACHLQVLAEGLGPYSSSNEVDIDSKREFVYGDLAVRSYWEHTVRAVLRRHPDARSWR